MDHGLLLYPHMTCILCIVLEISCLQAFIDKITLSSATMHINDIQHFDVIKSYILANNMITLNRKQNRYPVKL